MTSDPSDIKWIGFVTRGRSRVFDPMVILLLEHRACLYVFIMFVCLFGFLGPSGECMFSHEADGIDISQYP